MDYLWENLEISTSLIELWRLDYFESGTYLTKLQILPPSSSCVWVGERSCRPLLRCGGRNSQSEAGMWERRAVMMRSPVSLDKFERGRQVLCESAWLHNQELSYQQLRPATSRINPREKTINTSELYLTIIKRYHHVKRKISPESVKGLKAHYCRVKLLICLNRSATPTFCQTSSAWPWRTSQPANNLRHKKH